MSLTVPRAGEIAGRAAEIRVATPDTGAIIAEFGEKVLRVGQERIAEDLRLQGMRAELDITQGLAEARKAVEASGDFGGWDAAVADVRKRVLEPLDIRIREPLDIRADDLVFKHGEALASRRAAIGRAAGARNADSTWAELVPKIEIEGLNADPETLQKVLSIADEALAARVASGAISPDKARDQRAKLREKIFTARATEALAADPVAYLADAEGGKYNDLDIGTLARTRVAARSEIARQEEAARREAEAAATRAEAAIGRRLDEIGDLMLDGFKVTDEALLADPAVMANPAYPRAAAAQALRDELPTLKLLTPAEIDAQIAAERAKPKSFKFQTERVGALEEWRGQWVAKWNSAPLDVAREAGMPVPELPPYDPANPDAFVASLSERLAFDAALRGQGYTDTSAIFDAAEKTAFKAILAPEADPEVKTRLAFDLVRGTRLRPEQALTDLGADPVFRRAVQSITTTGGTELAREMLTGQQKIALKTVTVPTAEAGVRLFDATTGGIFADDPARAAGIMAAATAIYANSEPARILPDNPTSFMGNSAAVKAYGDAVQRALGASADRSGALTIGGVQDVRGVKLLLPPGLPRDRVVATFDGIETSLRAASRERRTEQSALAAGAAVSRLTAASVRSAAPELGTVPYELFKVLTPHRVGESDEYELHYTINGRSLPIPEASDPLGRAWRFSLSRLVAGGAP